MTWGQSDDYVYICEYIFADIECNGTKKKKIYFIWPTGMVVCLLYSMGMIMTEAGSWTCWMWGA